MTPGMYSANVEYDSHTGQHLQGCVSCYAYVERVERRARARAELVEAQRRVEFDDLLVGPPTTGGLVRHRRRRPTLAARLWARLARLVP